jgi:protein involved in polysaccharide export with SLBB domain
MIVHFDMNSTLPSTARRLFALAVVAPALLASAGCSSSSATATKATAMQAQMAAEPVYSVQEGEYRLSPGDQVSVDFMFHRDLNAGEVTVRREGDVTVSGLGEFYAAGLTAEELEERIYRRASLTYRNPQVSVVVLRRQEYRAYVGGEVRRPGFVGVRPGLTSMRAIFDRGGFLDTAKIDNVLHVRWDDDGSFTARVVDLKTMLETGDSRGDVALGPNDVVFVPKTRIANADLWVSQYILKLIPIRPPTTRLPEFDAPWADDDGG